MDRKDFLSQIESAFDVNPVVALLGPRQCGKTTLAKMFLVDKTNVLQFDLENPADLARLESPMFALDGSYDLIVIDEIQRRPELFPVLRVLIDKTKRKQKYLILGSASRDLIQQSSESLAGRISYLELTPFSLTEVNDTKKLWMRGGFPLSYLAESNTIAAAWRNSYITTFLERDVPGLGFKVPSAQLRRFWMMLAHYHSNIFNASEIGLSMGISHTAVNNYLGILTGTFMVRELQPWLENIGKRQVKSPKVFFRDSGILHSLMNIPDENALYFHPKLGASWEGFALEEVIRKLRLPPEQCFFWAVHGQAELDLLVFHNGKKLGFEVKHTDAPKVTRSMRNALELLKLDGLNIIYPGENSYPLDQHIHVWSLVDFVRLHHGSYIPIA